jgi:hypothetical protein
MLMALVLGAGACRKDAPPTEVAQSPSQASTQAKEAAEPFGRLTVEEVEARLKDPGPQGRLHVFDVNSKERFEKSHVPTATWLKFNDFKESDLPPQKNAPLVFYCANEH